MSDPLLLDTDVASYLFKRSHKLELVSNNLPHFEAAEQLCGLRLVRPGA